MRFFKISFITVCLAFCLTISNAAATEMTKIGLIDFQKILSMSDAGKAANQKIKTKMQALQEELQTKGAAIEEEQARYEREATVMSKEARSEKERELKIKAYDFQNLTTTYEDEMKAYQQELVAEFQNDVLEITKEIGKKEGYTLIIEKSSSGVVYAPSTIDLTDKVIQQYNESFASKSNG